MSQERTIPEGCFQLSFLLDDGPQGGICDTWGEVVEAIKEHYPDCPELRDSESSEDSMWDAIDGDLTTFSLSEEDQDLVPDIVAFVGFQRYTEV